MRTFKNLFSFYGRVRRSQFGYFVMLSFALALSIGVLFASNPFGDRPIPPLLESTLFVLGGVSFILWVVASASFTVRRLHDMSLSGWLYILFALAKFIPFASLLIVAWLVFAPGTKGTNSFGPDPRAPKHAALAEVFDAPPT